MYCCIKSVIPNLFTELFKKIWVCFVWTSCQYITNIIQIIHFIINAPLSSFLWDIKTIPPILANHVGKTKLRDRRIVLPKYWRMWLCRFTWIVLHFLFKFYVLRRTSTNRKVFYHHILWSYYCITTIYSVSRWILSERFGHYLYLFLNFSISFVYLLYRKHNVKAK